MNLEDVIKTMPYDSVGVQWLSECLTNIRQKKKPTEHHEVSFVTEAIDAGFAFGKSDKICAIVWMDKGEFKKAVDKLEKGGAL